MSGSPEGARRGGNRFAPLSPKQPAKSATSSRKNVIPKDNLTTSNNSINPGKQYQKECISVSPMEKNAPKKFKTSGVEDTTDVLMGEIITDNVTDTGIIRHNDHDNVSPVSTRGRQLNVPVCFPANYSGSLVILIASSSHENNLGKLHPISIGKFQKTKISAAFYLSCRLVLNALRFFSSQ